MRNKAIEMVINAQVEAENKKRVQKIVLGKYTFKFTKDGFCELYEDKELLDTTYLMDNMISWVAEILEEI